MHCCVMSGGFDGVKRMIPLGRRAAGPQAAAFSCSGSSKMTLRITKFLTYFEVRRHKTVSQQTGPTVRAS